MSFDKKTEREEPCDSSRSLECEKSKRQRRYFFFFAAAFFAGFLAAAFFAGFFLAASFFAGFLAIDNPPFPCAVAHRKSHGVKLLG